MHICRLLLLPLVVTILIGCEATAPLGSVSTLPPDAAANCSHLCSEAGLEMSSMVIIASSIGCVCQVKGKSAAAGNSAVAAIAGATVIEEQRRASAAAMRH
jgi:hypothetical protein